MTTNRLILVCLVAFLYLLLWIALAVRFVPDVVDELTDDSLVKALLNVAISGTLLLIPFYAIWLFANSGRVGRNPPAL